MLIIGLDYHPSVQQIAFLDKETGECGERRLAHSNGDAERFYRELRQREISVRVGMAATGNTRWFERLMMELGFELWMGDPAQIRAKRVPKQKTDRQDAQLLLNLLLEDRFPRMWVPSLQASLGDVLGIFQLERNGARTVGADVCLKSRLTEPTLLEMARQIAVLRAESSQVPCNIARTAIHCGHIV